ncbi:etoposide-induced homolog [Paramuricea clavata]|uniref:Etoposide-induced homolog n=1 Tax=Paramuricea clavata TaxID=317549 RepID=A0A6S7IXW5_PARCT|nr:etoposide-induced homolog [Paramuricea clavata]
MSILLFENYLIPVLQRLTYFIFKTITGSETTQSLMWMWMVPALSSIFRAFWVIPLFWLTKPLNSLWYQEIADLAYRRRSGKPTVLLSSSGSFAQNVSLTIADIFFSLLIQGFFLLQATLVSIVPIVGPILSLLHMTLLHSLYCFEYTWVNKGWRVDKRLAFIETNWPYFVGFGLPLALLTNGSNSLVVSGCIFAILFPLFIVSANEAQPIETQSVPVRIFSVSVWLTNKVLRRSWTRTNLQSKNK